MNFELPFESDTILVLIVTTVVAGFILLLMAWRFRGSKGSKGEKGSEGKKGSKGKKRRRGRVFEMTCSICQAELTMTKNELGRVPATESALMVSQEPSIMGRPLGEYDCPECGATHYFCMDTKPPTYALTGAFIPQKRSNLCAQCRRPLERPSWPRGQFDRDIGKAPNLKGLHGLKCSRCEAVSCVKCCADTTGNRTKDGSFLCPRCNRGPVDVFHHF